MNNGRSRKVGTLRAVAHQQRRWAWRGHAVVQQGKALLAASTDATGMEQGHGWVVLVRCPARQTKGHGARRGRYEAGCGSAFSAVVLETGGLRWEGSCLPLRRRCDPLTAQGGDAVLASAWRSSGRCMAPQRAAARGGRVALVVSSDMQSLVEVSPWPGSTVAPAERRSEEGRGWSGDG
jgi:hypothetical protein